MKHRFEIESLELHTEDSGQALIGDVFNDMGDNEPHMFGRVQSWDEDKQHLALRALEGKTVQVTVEEVKQPIYEYKAGYELGMGDFLIKVCQLLDKAIDNDDLQAMLQARNALANRIGTTPYTPDGCRIPYYPI